jgi:hypothetical protein
MLHLECVRRELPKAGASKRHEEKLKSPLPETAKGFFVLQRDKRKAVISNS